MSEPVSTDQPKSDGKPKKDFLVADRSLRPEGTHFAAESGAVLENVNKGS